MMKEGVDEGARIVSESRMNHHPGRLIEDDKMLVLE
jgi:hypothetical protein